MTAYREHWSGRVLERRVECFWTIEGPQLTNRVYPDGCMDFIYIRRGGRSRLDLVGAMTRYEDVPVEPGDYLLGVRFRPGMLRGVVGSDCSEHADQTEALAAVLPREARWLKQRLDDDPAPDAFSRLLEGVVAQAPPPDAVQKALAYIEQQRGVVDLDWIARQANLGERQFRRAAIAYSGLAPKQLCRVLRFRYAMSRLASARRGDLTGIALECGYFDQAHFIRDFSEWTGAAPSSFIR